jgi:hypothetical protein
MATSVVAVELREQLLAQEREMKSKEGIVAGREDHLAVFECTLGRVHMERDAELTRAKAIRQDYLAKMCTFKASCQCYFTFDRILGEHRALLSV